MAFKLFDLGLADFQSAWDFQKKIFLQVKQKELFSALILCQHKPVITLGRKSKRENILTEETELERSNIKTYQIERGGDVTYHGPGQLCIYPIANLAYFKRDINWFLRSLEATLLEVLFDFGIKAEAIPGLTGIWVNSTQTNVGVESKQEKIASIGIAIRNWITFHGASLNIKRDDLANFSLIRPCGLDIIMTSMEDVLGKEVRINRVKETLKRRWYETSNFARTG
ncbi:MAG: hypothetical protein AMJ78_00345 [Omnitrophica WOR_2 bacterium SM23_29]|nr:MAG: hypothetical protein AMJ78_00345 [Omnitrophica WOR_2 bacterium SM23_29]